MKDNDRGGLRLVESKPDGYDFIGLARAAIDALPANVRSEVIAICDEERFNIPESHRESVLWWVHRARHFRQNESSLALTRKERVSGLGEVQRAATDLLQALDALSTADRADLAIAMRASLHGLFMDTPIEPQLLGVRAAAQLLELNLQDTGGKGPGGRRPVGKHYAAIVAGLSHAAAAAGMPLRSGGPFQSFCEKIFKAAGIPANAEAAVRAFKSDRSKPA